MTPAPTGSTTKIASAAPILAKAPPAAKMSVVVPPALVRAGTVTPPEQRSPSGRGRPDAALPAWPLGVRVAVEAPVPKVSSSA